MLKISNKLTIKCSVLLALASYNYGANAQDNMLPIPPTPQAAQFMRYGDIPVGHTTGVPQIEIPIYTISTGLIDIPISISYHASGFKVNDVASPVGLGWVLNANGWMISRSVQGTPDHYSRYKKYRLDSDNTIRTPEDLEKVKNGQKKINNTDFSNPSSAEFWHTYFIKNGSWPLCDVRSDRYFYSFPGHTGSAQYSADNMDIGLQTIPYEPLVFKYDTDKDIYTITDTKGIIYTFAQLEHNKPDGEEKIISGWYLTKIQFPGLTDVVTFTYDEEGIEFTTQNYVQTDKYFFYEPPYGAYDHADPYTPIHSVTGTGYTTKPILLSEIKWKNTVVKFTYAEDSTEITKDRLTRINVFNKINSNDTIWIREVQFNNNTYFGTKKENHRLKLSGIEFTYPGEKYSFGYDESKNANLPEYYWSSSNNIKSAEDYWGYWNGTSSYYVFPKAVADYYNNNEMGTFINKYHLGEDNLLKGVDKDPSLDYTRACILTEIKYPTKGKTCFDYELNVGDFNSTEIKTKNGKLGGLRVKRITNYSENGSNIGTKEYEYSGKSVYSEYGKNGVFRFENLFFSSKPFVDYYSTNDVAHEAQLLYPTTFSSTPLQCYFDAAKSPVFYDMVTEYNGTKNSNNGRTVYYYTKASNRVSTNTVNYTGPHELLAFVKSVDCDFGSDQGILTQQTVYDKGGKKQYEKSISYSNYVKTLKTGVRMDMYLDVDVSGSLTSIAVDAPRIIIPGGSMVANHYNLILDNIIAVQTYAYQTVSEPTSVSECWYDENGRSLSKISSYSYFYKNNDKLPMITKPYKTNVVNSNGLAYSEYNYYSCQYSEAPYSEMNNKKMYEYLVGVQKLVGGKTTEYNETPYYKTNGLFLPKAMVKDDEQRIEYLNYDSRGNLNYAIKDNWQKVVTLYSYNYTHPVFIVEGATLQQVTNILKNNGFSSVEQLGAAVPSDEQIESIGKSLRKNLPSATMVSTYTYKLNVGVTSTTDCRGYKTIYEYDAAGRLINVWEPDEKDEKEQNLLSKYKYNYSTK